MSEQAARAALERMSTREVAIARHYTGLAADLRHLAEAVPEEENAKFLAARGELCAAYGFTQQAQSKPFAFADGIAIIPIHGTLINRFGGSWGYVTGYNFIRSQLTQAMSDPDVKGIVFDVNSHGGEVAGCFELGEDIFAMRGQKPMVAVVDSNCYSAAYALASAADKIVITPTGGAGSIGVVAMHVDVSKMMADWGVKITFIHAGAHKVDGNPFEALPDDVREDIQAGVDASYDKFVAYVARNRNVDESKVRDTEARIYRAEAALGLGLVDAIASPSEAVVAFFGELSGSDITQEDETMSNTQTQPGADATITPDMVAKATAEAKVAERARIQGITQSEEAKGRSTLANHLALNTDLSVDQAKAILAASPLEAAAATAQDQATSKGNPFEATMNRSQHPQVGPDDDAGASGDDKGLSAAASILRAQEMATGMKLITQ